MVINKIQNRKVKCIGQTYLIKCKFVYKYLVFRFYCCLAWFLKDFYLILKFLNFLYKLYDTFKSEWSFCLQMDQLEILNKFLDFR